MRSTLGRVKLAMSDAYTLAPSLIRATVEDYAALFRASFSGDGKLTAKYLNWEYRENPHGEVIGFDAFHGDELAAHYAIIPRRYRLGAQVVDGALSINTATHPMHQGKGLFIKLAEATYKAASERGVKFVVGVANASSIGGFTRRLGFTELGRVRLYGCFRAPECAQDALALGIDADWINWRLANPSRRYVIVRHRGGSSTIRTHVRGVPFNVARIENEVILRSRVREYVGTGSALVPGLAPIFSTPPPRWPRLPLKAQPSPWHVIWRALHTQYDLPMREHLHIDGLSMDTF